MKELNVASFPSKFILCLNEKNLNFKYFLIFIFISFFRNQYLITRNENNLKFKCMHPPPFYVSYSSLPSTIDSWFKLYQKKGILKKERKKEKALYNQPFK